MGKYFGTDGIRDVVNAGLDAELAYKVGRAAAYILSEKKGGKPVFVIGKDTRISCDMLEGAIMAGLCASGANVILLGVLPTPAVAYITKISGADAGVMISASHNTFEHNGIKIFNSQGFKLSDEIEEKIEDLLDDPGIMTLKTGKDIGHVIPRGNEYIDHYINYIAGFGTENIKDIRVIIDCSNGAAARTAREIFSRFPIDAEFICDNPDGTNINEDCGSTNMGRLSRMIVAGGYDIGIAFDGDADRCLAVDENGTLVDGDKIMGVLGLDMKAEGLLKKNSIVATVMSNMGFHMFCQGNGIALECAAVGDRYVLEKMLECGYNLGGEQSGHIIFLDDHSTGDGQLAAVKLLNILSKSRKKISELVSDIKSFPQFLTNIRIEGGEKMKDEVMKDPALTAAIAQEELMLEGKGRILVRPSGTEPLIRVMVEAESEHIANKVTEYLEEIIKNIVIKVQP